MRKASPIDLNTPLPHSTCEQSDWSCRNLPARQSRPDHEILQDKAPAGDRTPPNYDLFSMALGNAVATRRPDGPPRDQKV
jgi:hypothetical protein